MQIKIGKKLKKNLLLKKEENDIYLNEKNRKDKGYTKNWKQSLFLFPFFLYF